MSVVTLIQPVLGLTTQLTALDPAGVTLTQLGQLQTQLSGSFTQQISLINTGLMGPPGAAADAFQFTQAVAASEWIINHNLGFRPNVVPMTNGGLKMVAEILHMSTNQVRVYFDAPTAGIATCS